MATKENTTTEPGFLLWKAANTWQRETRNALVSTGLTHVQFLLLDTLSKNAGMKQSQLAEAAGTDQMMTSKVLRMLVQKKLIQRKSPRNDARAFLVSISPEGEKKLAKARILLSKMESAFFEKIEKRKRFIKNLELLCGEE
jgi:DNA-binding MarR family transcriptional regulator